MVILLRKMIFKSVIVAVFILIVIVAIRPFEHFRLIDRYIKYNISSEISMLDLVIADISEILLTDDAYKTLDIELMHKEVLDARDKVFLIDKSIEKLDLLNNNYDFNLYGVIDYLDELEGILSSNKRPTDTDMNTLVAIKEIIRKYHNSTVLSYYEDDKTGYTRLEVPEKTKLLFEALNNLGISE